MDEQQGSGNRLIIFFIALGVIALGFSFNHKKGAVTTTVAVESRPELPQAAAEPVVSEVQEALPPTSEMLTAGQCADTCRDKVKKQEILNRGMPAGITPLNPPVGGFGAGDYRVLWSDCEQKVFVGFPARSREIPYLFLWPRGERCRCAAGYSVLRIAEDGTCELMK